MFGEDFAGVGDCGGVESEDEDYDGRAVVGAADAEVHYQVSVTERNFASFVDDVVTDSP